MRTLSSFLFSLLFCVCLTSWAQNSADNSKPVDASKPDEQKQDPLKRPLSSKQRKQMFKGAKETPYDKWVKQDVRWIITPAELEAFNRLSNDEERDAFVENFWLRRDPTPDTAENEFKEEHYRRIAYANEHFAAGTPGSLTDRGHIYIAWGPPDEIESHPSGGTYNRDISEGGGSTTTYPFERWRYRHLENVGDNVILEFVDACMCNEYRLTIDPNEKDALQHVTGGVPNALLNTTNRNDEFENLDKLVKVTSAPAIKFPDLLARVNTRITENPLPFDVHTDFVRVTGDTVLVPVTVELKNRDITFVNQDGVQRGTVQLLGRVSTITGRVVQTFEDTVQIDVPADLFTKSVDNVALYWKALPLPPRMYRLDIVAKDVNGDHYGSYGKSLHVPEFAEDKLATSSLVLADLVEPVAKTDIGKGNFVIGATKIRPRVEPSDGTPPKFRRNERLNLWMQVYNLALDERTRQPSATIQYAVVNDRSGKTVLDVTESTNQLANPGEQITLQKAIALKPLEPGTYRITITVSDAVSKQTVAPTAKFVVE